MWFVCMWSAARRAACVAVCLVSFVVRCGGISDSTAAATKENTKATVVSCGGAAEGPAAGASWPWAWAGV